MNQHAAFLVCLSLLVAATAKVDAQTSELLTTHILRLGSDPYLYETTNATTGPLLDGANATFSNITLSADYGLLKVTTDTVMPTSSTSLSVNPSAYAQWVDGFNFTPSNSSLIGSAAIARFTFSLSGNWDFSFDHSASGGLVLYDIELNGNSFNGSNNLVGGPHGEQNFGNYSTMTMDQPINLGTPFTITVLLQDGSSLQNSSVGSSFANVSLQLASTGLQVFDSGNVLIPGTWNTDSGHDYTLSSIPEPSVWAIIPGLTCLTLVYRRKRRAD